MSESRLNGNGIIIIVQYQNGNDQFLIAILNINESITVKVPENKLFIPLVQEIFSNAALFAVVTTCKSDDGHSVYFEDVVQNIRFQRCRLHWHQHLETKHNLSPADGTKEHFRTSKRSFIACTNPFPSLSSETRTSHPEVAVSLC